MILLPKPRVTQEDKFASLYICIKINPTAFENCRVMGMKSYLIYRRGKVSLYIVYTIYYFFCNVDAFEFGLMIENWTGRH